MSFFGSSNEHDMVLSIGSSGVSGAILLVQEGGKPTISQTSRSPFPVRKDVTAHNLVNSLQGALDKVIANLCHSHKQKIKTVHVVFTSPWFSSFSKTLSINKPESFVVNEKVVEKLVADQMAEVAKTSVADDSLIIEKSIAHIKLNGYETSTPYGQSAKTLEVAMYASLAPKLVQQKVEAEIYKTIHPSNILFHTFPFVAWQVINRLFTPQADFVLIDIGGEISDVLVVKRGAIQTLFSFPVGAHHLIRKAAEHFESQPEFSESIISLYASDTVEAGLKEKTAALVSAFGEEWGLGFRQITSGNNSLGNDAFLPQRAFLISDYKFSPVFDEIVSKVVPNVTSLAKENLAQFVNLPVGVVPNIFIAIDAIYINSKISV